MATILQSPPAFDGDNYEHWRNKVEAWRILTKLPKDKQALAVYVGLKGTAESAISAIQISDLNKDNGLDTLLGKLDQLYLVDVGRRQFAALDKLHNLRRDETVSIRQFVVEFDNFLSKFDRLGLVLPDIVKAYQILKACNMPEKDQQLVMSAVEEPTYDKVKSALSRIFGNDVNRPRPISKDDSFLELASGPRPSVSVKSEPIMLTESGENNEEAYYVKNRPRPNDKDTTRGARPIRGQWRQRGGRGRPRGATNFSSKPNLRRERNPNDYNGEVTRCLICQSIYHWARNCPHAYENNENKTESVNLGLNSESDWCESAHVNLFVGYTDRPNESEKGAVGINNLVNEALGCALLDSGCSTSVCGTRWLKDFCSRLSDTERGKIVKNESKAKFSFADGKTVSSLERVTLPCYIGGLYASVTTDVIECDIPLLLSKSAMKKGKMILNFGTDKVELMGARVNLKNSRSGHYLLPL